MTPHNIFDRKVFNFKSELDLQEYFYQFGEVAAINVVSKNSCAFVQFTRRDSAEHAASKTFGKLDIKVSVKIKF